MSYSSHLWHAVVLKFYGGTLVSCISLEPVVRGVLSRVPWRRVSALTVGLFPENQHTYVEWVPWVLISNPMTCQGHEFSSPATRLLPDIVSVMGAQRGLWTMGDRGPTLLTGHGGGLVDVTFPTENTPELRIWCLWCLSLWSVTLRATGGLHRGLVWRLGPQVAVYFRLAQDACLRSPVLSHSLSESVVEILFCTQATTLFCLVGFTKL